MRLPRLTFPLLRKELVEQAARRRTYVVRVVYASLLFSGFGLLYLSMLQYSGRSPMAALGLGRQVFEMLMGLQFAGVLLFLPAMMSTVLTHEKERDSLGLLFLTDLHPWEILLEKYLGRLAAIFCFLLMGLPLLAVAYSLGGFSTDYLAGGLYLLLVTCLQVGAIALFCSAWSRSSTGAFLGSYLVGGLFYYAPPVLYLILQDVLRLLPRLPERTLTSHIPPMLFGTWSGQSLSELMLLGLPALASAGAFLLAARLALLRRAFLPPRNHLLGLFQALDRLMTRLNRITGGIVLLRPSAGDPGNEPVAWREVNKRALGQIHYRLRLLLLMMLPTAFAILITFTSSPRDTDEKLGALAGVLWGVAALTLTVKGVAALAGERTRQTLDVLLTTPMLGREIVLQKMAGLRKLLPLFYLPLVLLALTKFWWLIESPRYSYYNRRAPDAALRYGLSAAIQLALYPPLLCWFAVWLGLRVKAHGRAVMLLFGCLLIWFAVPPLAAAVVSGVFGVPGDVAAFLMLFSPAATLAINESGVRLLLLPSAWTLFAPWNVLLWHLLRRDCLNNANRYLGRASRPAWS